HAGRERPRRHSPAGAARQTTRAFAPHLNDPLAVPHRPEEPRPRGTRIKFPDPCSWLVEQPPDGLDHAAPPVILGHPPRDTLALARVALAQHEAAQQIDVHGAPSEMRKRQRLTPA